MRWQEWSATLDETTHGILFGFAGLIILAVILFLTGWLGKIFGFIGKVLQACINWGFRNWERTLWWTSALTYLLLVSLFLTLGIYFAHLPDWSVLAFAAALILLGMGVVTCLAFMFVSLERYQVSRGYKAVHNPAKGQELAISFARYGARFGPVRLCIAAIATITAFALLNQLIYENINPRWYVIRADESSPKYADFLAFTLINFIRVVDILDLLRSSHMLNVSIVRQGAWPVSTLLVLFKSFFTLVLVQQVMAAIRDERLLWEMIEDFSSPHPPIHERARRGLSQFGPMVIAPIMQSFGQTEHLTREQREELPKVLAEIGPPAIPLLRNYLHDEREIIRAVSAVALGHLRAVEVAPEIASLCRDDANENVRACAADALGAIGEAQASNNSKTVPLGRVVRKRATLVAVMMYGAKLPVHGAKFIWKKWKKAIRSSWKAYYDHSADPLACCTESLRYALLDAAAAVRVQAAAALGQIGPSAADATADLIRLMETGSEQERALTIAALGKIKSFPETVVPILAKMTADGSAVVRTAAAIAMGEYREQAAEGVAALVALLNDPLENVRAAATTAIQQIGALDEESSRALADKLAHPDNLTRAQTAETLGEMGEAAHSTVPALVDSLQDENDRVRGKAAEALGKIGEVAADESVPALIQSLRDVDNHVISLAVEALGQMGERARQAIPELIELVRNENAQVRARSIATLGQLKAGQARSALEAACRDEDVAVKIQAIIALGKLGDAVGATRHTLVELLQDEVPQVRAEAAETLASCGDCDEQTVLQIAALLDDSSEEVALRAIRVLPKFHHLSLSSILEILSRRLTDEQNAHIALAAARALGQFGTSALAAGPGLGIAAKTGDAILRRAALHALAMILPPDAAAAFVAGLRDAEASVRIMASAGLIKLGACPEEILPDLVETLRDPDLRVRANGVAVFVKLETLPAETETLLVNSVGLPKTALRRLVALALRKFDTATAREALQALTVDPDERVKQIALESLRILEPESTQPDEEKAPIPVDASVALALPAEG